MDIQGCSVYAFEFQSHRLAILIRSSVGEVSENEAASTRASVVVAMRTKLLPRVISCEWWPCEQASGDVSSVSGVGTMVPSVRRPSLLLAARTRPLLRVPVPVVVR